MPEAADGRSLETEIKLSIPDEKVFSRMLRLRFLPGYSLGVVREVLATDTFKDSEDFGLLRAGLALRERDEGGRYRVTVKGLSNRGRAYHQREEIEELRDAPMTRVDQLTGPVGRRVLPLLAGHGIVDLFSFTQARHVRSLSRGGSRVAELSIDRVTLSRGGVSEVYFEAEVESAAAGADCELPAIGRWLSDAFGLSSESRTKFERAAEFFEMKFPGALSAFANRGRGDGLDGGMPPARAVGALVSVELAEVARLESDVLSSPSIDAVHDMRVACRRARSLLRLVPESGSKTRDAMRFLRTLRDHLGSLRDMQVLPKTLDRALGAVGFGAEGMLKSMADETRRREIELLEYLRSDSYHAGREVYDVDFAMVLDPAFRYYPRELRHALVPIIFHRIGVADSFRKAVRVDSRTDHHELRKLIKSVRYALEAFAPLLGVNATRLAEVAKAVQDPLGVVQDVETAQELLGRLGLMSDSLARALDGLADSETERFSQAWLRFCDPQLRLAVAREISTI